MNEDDALVGKELKESDPLFYKTILFIQKNKNRNLSEKIKTKSHVLQYVSHIANKIFDNTEIVTYIPDKFTLINTKFKGMSMGFGAMMSYINYSLRNLIEDENTIFTATLIPNEGFAHLAVIYIPIPGNVNLNEEEDENKFIYDEMKDIKGYDELKKYIKTKFKHTY